MAAGAAGRRTLDVGVDPTLPADVATALAAHLERRWPDVRRTGLTLPAPDRDARDGPVLVVLAPSATPPPADPGALAVVRYDVAHPPEPEALWRRVDAQLARVLTARFGEGPARRVGVREGMTRAEFLRLDRTFGEPLPEVPWVEAGRCLHDHGCAACTAVCRADALRFGADGAVAVDVGVCRGCGACVAACPTGALQSACTADEQWLALAATWTEDGHARALRAQCPRAETDPVGAGDTLAVPVACVAEIGWHHLLTGAVATGRPPLVACPDAACPSYADARAALARAAALAATAATASGPAPSPAAVEPRLDERVPRRARTAEAARTLLAEGRLADDGASRAGLAWSVEAAPPAVCTLCGACAQACPAQALAVEQGALEAIASTGSTMVGAGVVRFDAARCVGCGACVAVCPEHALALMPAAPHVLASAPTTVHQVAPGRCPGCGRPYESPAFVAAVRARLRASGFSDAFLERLAYCESCRATVRP
jgi:ferredoxin